MVHRGRVGVQQATTSEQAKAGGGRGVDCRCWKRREATAARAGWERAEGGK